MRRKEALKRKAEPGQSGKAAEGNKRRKKEWWDKTDTQRPVEEDDDVEHYRKEVSPPKISVRADREKAWACFYLNGHQCTGVAWLAMLLVMR